QLRRYALVRSAVSASTVIPGLLRAKISSQVMLYVVRYRFHISPKSSAAETPMGMKALGVRSCVAAKPRGATPMIVYVAAPIRIALPRTLSGPAYFDCQ